MKKLNINYRKNYSTILTILLALLGFSCAKDPKVEYGTPNARFIVKGKVTSSDLNEPVKNIRVIMRFDTTFTDNSGNYQITDRDGFPTDQTYLINFRDIDGSLNGNYEDEDTTVEFKNPQFTGGDGHWYQGETTKNLDIKLNPRK